MNLCFEIVLNKDFRSLASRDAGLRLKLEIQAAMASSDVVVVNFRGRDLTPSFADECFGALAAEVGLQQFKSKVRSKNVPPKAKALLSHVIQQRVQARAAECISDSALSA